MANIEKEYLVKRGTQEYTPISELFNGVRILKVNGFTSTGAPKNIYTAAWINSQAEDYMVTLQESREGEDYDVVIRNNTDIEITFIVGDKYADTDIDVRVTHDAFIAYMTDGALYVKSNYTDRAMKVVCLKEYKPTLVRLKRQAKNNYITGTITLHALDTRAGDDDGYIGNPYPTTSEEGGGGGGGEPLSINTTQVYDPYFGKTQQDLNKQFAQVQQQADWAQTDASAVDFIKNKPDLGLYLQKTDDDGHGNKSFYGQGNITMTLADKQGVINQIGTFSAGGWSVSSPDGKFQTFGNSIYRGTMGLDRDSVVWEKTATQQIPAATTSANGLMSASDKSKLDALPTNEQLTEELGDKADSADLAEVATSGSYNDLSDKPDLSAFITKLVDDLTNYYLKSETYTKNEVLQLIGAIQQFHYEVYATLPQTGASNVLYLIGPIGAGADKYEEYVYANNNWTKIGDTSIDLADYVTSSALGAALANYYNKNDVDGLLAGKQDTIQDLDAIRRGSQAGATAVQTETLNSALSNTVAESGVYDVTANNNNAKFASLSALLSSENLNTLIPSAKRKGGMSIKFVLSSDNIYVQYRLTTEEFSTDVDDWQGVDNVPTANSKNLVTSGGVYDALQQGEYVVATATADTGSVATAMVGIYDVNDVLIVEGEGEVTARISYGKTYKVRCSRVYDHLTPAEQTFVASIPSRQVMMQYTYIERDVVTLDQTISDPAQMLYGDIQGDVIKEIRSHSHLYLGTPTTQSGDTEGTELLCQLSDEDSRLYYDGTPAALDGSEGDQWLKLPVFWWKVVGVGEAAVDGAHDQYRLMFAFAGEPDPSWNKWQGDRNLVGAKEMKVVNDKGRSVSDGQSTGGFIQAKGNAYAAARNLGCQLVTWEWHWIMCVLFYAWYGNTNSQAVCGIGSSSYNRTLGVTDKLGMTDTTPAQATSLTSARFWGLESWWNCKMEWMGNVVMEDYVLRITDQDTKQTRQVSGFIQCGSSSGGWNSRMRIDANGDLVPLAKAGTETTFYCDWVNSNSGSRVVSRGGSYAGAYGGVSYASAFNDASYSSAYVGSRLAFNGAITEAESVAAYKAALA